MQVWSEFWILVEAYERALPDPRNRLTFDNFSTER